MGSSELSSLPLVSAAFALLLVASVVLSGTSFRAGIPVILPFLGLGVLGSGTGLAHLFRQTYHESFILGNLALVLILFDGGLNLRLSQARPVVLPSLLLATFGVVGTAALFAVCARLFGFSWGQAFLLGAIVSPTDAAAVFPILRGSGLQLQKRVASILELESGLNDPVAVTLTTAIVSGLNTTRIVVVDNLTHMLSALLIGGAIGAVIGLTGRILLARVRPAAGGLYPLMTLGFSLLAFGLPELAGGSGFLGVYVAGILIGNGEMPYRGGILRVHDSLAWLGQVVMYLLLGSLINPRDLIAVAPKGIVLGLLLSLVARPLTVALCILPFRYSLREVIYLACVGLRGALPIILAMYPVFSRTKGAPLIFHSVFFVVLVNAFVPGAMVRWLTKRLELRSEEPPPPPALLEIISTHILTGAEIISFSLEPYAAACGVPISELPFPAEAAVILLIRNNEIIVPKGATVLKSGDHVYVLCKPEDKPFIQLIFGRSEAS